LYFAGFPNYLINEENTNKLDWKKAKAYWTPDLLDRLENYFPFGPKPAPNSKLVMIDKLIEQLNSLQPNIEGLKEYSYVLGKLIEFLNISKN